MPSSILTTDQVRSFVKKNSKYHIKFIEDKVAGTIVGHDNNEVFFRALQKDPETWICTFTETKVMKFNGLHTLPSAQEDESDGQDS